MTSQFENLMPRIVARGLIALRQKAVLPQLVNSDFSAEATKKGAVIDVPVSRRIEATDVTPSASAPELPEANMHSVPITLNHWKKAAFYLTDQEMDQIEAHESFIPLQMAEAISALSYAVNQSIITALGEASQFTGSYGNVPLGAPEDPAQPKAYEGLQPIIDTRRILNQNLVPKNNRYFIITYDSEASLLSQQSFADAAKIGHSKTVLDGEIGRRFGFDFFSIDNLDAYPDLPKVMPLHANLTPTTTTVYVTNQDKDVVGKHIYFENYPRSFKVGIVTTANSYKRIFISEAVGENLSSGTNVYLNGGPMAGVAFHRDAVALAMRPLSMTGMATGHNGHIMSITDPETGLSLRLEVSRQYKQTVWEFDMLWGVALVRPEAAIKLASA